MTHTHSPLFSIHLVVFAQQGVWLGTGIPAEMRMSLKVLKQLLKVQENAAEAFGDALATESGKPSSWLHRLHRDSLP